MNKSKFIRTTSLKEIGILGQDKLLVSRVFIVGIGGLGNQILLHLSSLGIGEIGFADIDEVQLDNLPRQVLYGEGDVGLLKTDVAYHRIMEKSPGVRLNKFNVLVDQYNAKDLFKGYDIVIDATDNFKTKFIVEDACKSLGIPFVIAGVSGYKGQVILVTNKSKYSFKSLFDELPINIEEKYIEEDKAVYPLAVSLVSDVAANEVVKYLLNLGEQEIDELITVDSLKTEIKKYRFE